MFIMLCKAMAPLSESAELAASNLISQHTTAIESTQRFSYTYFRHFPHERLTDEAAGLPPPPPPMIEHKIGISLSVVDYVKLVFTLSLAHVISVTQ